MRGPRSLRGQLVLWLLPLHLLTTALLGWAFYCSYGEVVFGFMEGQMRALAHSHAARSCAGMAAPLHLNDDEVHEDGNFIVQLWCAGDLARHVSGRPGLDVPLQPEAGWHDVSGGGERWRVYTAPLDPANGEVHAQVLQSERFRRLEIGGRAVFASLTGLLLLLVALVVLAKVIGRSSRRLRGTAQQLARRDEHSGGVPTELDVPSEMAPLVQSFEALLTRLREALGAQRRFVQDAAHELRTPLTALNLQLENLRPHMAGAEAQFAELQRGMHRARHLVEQMLSLSRQDAARFDVSDASLDLRLLLRASIGQAMALADRRGIEVGFVDGIAGPLVLKAVEGDLRSLFDNLVDNALRHTPAGGEIELRLQAAGEARWVDVVDSGPGLPEAMRERVFDRFFRMPDAPAGGSGLGLAIARQAGLRHGLRIELLAREDGRTGLVARVHLSSR